MRPLLISKQQFWAWAVCDTVGFVLWMFGPGLLDWLALLIVSFATLLLMTRDERTQPVPRKTILWIFAALLGSALLMIALTLLLPQSNADPQPQIVKIIHHPALVVPLWALLLWMTYRQWKSSDVRRVAQSSAPK